MLKEAETLGFYPTAFSGGLIQRLQIRTIGQILGGNGFEVPTAALLYGGKAASAVQREAGQGELSLE